jgi:NTE family protein
LRKSPRERCLLLAGAAAAGLLAGCAHYLVNPPLASYNQQQGYRFNNLKAPDNSDGLFVILAFSGGGTRAAALSYGVLEQLAKTPIYWEGEVKPLLSEVDVISSVSGGSFTAAYYALFGDRIFKDFQQKFLNQPIQSKLVRSLFYPQNFLRLPSPHFDRIDMAAEIYDRDIFEHKTFADLIRKGTRPYLILNATDISTGSRFEFTQDQFDLFCSDLAGVPIARGVAASSAFPGLLSPLTLRSYAGSCGYQPPSWVAEAKNDADLNPRRQAAAVTLLSFLDPSTRKFVHLLDGGLSDNIGLRAPLAALTTNDLSWSLVNAINNGKIKKIVIITVNARPETENEWDLREKAPGLVASLTSAAETPIGHYSFETVELLKTELTQRQRDEQSRADCAAILHEKCPDAALPGGAFPHVEYFSIDVSFKNLADDGERRFFEGLPTNFQLAPATIDCLRGVGASLLTQSAAFRDLLDDLDKAARAAGAQPPPRLPAVASAWPCGVAGVGAVGGARTQAAVP